MMKFTTAAFIVLFTSTATIALAETAYNILAFTIVQINSMIHFAEMYYTVKVSDTRDDDSSNAV